jgi:hypothetical protein
MASFTHTLVAEIQITHYVLAVGAVRYAVCASAKTISKGRTISLR